MSYPASDDTNMYSELLRHKEFYSLKMDPDRDFRDPPLSYDHLHALLASKYLKLRSHQLFVKNLQNPNTKIRRLHLRHATGSGKTLSACGIAHEFIRLYRKLFAVESMRRRPADLDRSTPTVFVLGFGGTKAAFIRELLRYPEFGFVTSAEKAELVTRQRLAESGLPDDIKAAQDYYQMLRKRITNKSRGGFYKFFGYDEFVNRLFVGDGVKLVDIDADWMDRRKTNPDLQLSDVIREYIAAGKIQINTTLLKMFENSLLICDEIHNTYNTGSKNNRGVAIQYVLDSVLNMWLLTMSATPVNNSPTEIIELMNYLIAGTPLNKRDFFSNPRTLIPGKLSELGRLSRGHFSFLQDVNIAYYPRKNFVGVKIPEIPYFSFTPCPMSEIHQYTYDHMHVDIALKDTPSDDEITDAEIYGLPTDGYTMYDMVLPNPSSAHVGLFRSSDIRAGLIGASAEWKRANMITMKKLPTGQLITGDFLLRRNIGTWSTKYATLLDILFDIIHSGNGGKIMIYHDRKIMSGALMIQELLKVNGMADEYSEPTEATICMYCGRSMHEHTNSSPDPQVNHPDKSHEFTPLRFVMAHSDIERSTMERSLHKYNAANNAYGNKFMILVGSKIIQESYDFKDIQHLIVLSLPVDVPTLLQVFGRCIRTNSHINLPPDLRQVNIHMLITVGSQATLNSPEVRRYQDKLADYMVIQDIEQEIDRNAIDADIHRDIIMPPKLREEYFPAGNGPIRMLGNLYFEPEYVTPVYTYSDLNLITWGAYRHYEEELATITYIIKRLFILAPAWTYDELWRAVKQPPFGVESNPALFSEGNFAIVLTAFITPQTPIAGTRDANMVDQLFDGSKTIMRNGVKHKIMQIGIWYIAFPFDQSEEQPMGYENVRDRERLMIARTPIPSSRVIVDVETYMRGVKPVQHARVHVQDFITQAKSHQDYISQREKFITSDDDKYSFLYDYSQNFQIQFTADAIVWICGGGDGVGKESTELTIKYQSTLDLLSDLGVLIYAPEVAKYKDMVKQFKDNLVPQGNIPIGYMLAKVIKLYDPARTEWIEVSKLSMNRHASYKENDIIIGYFESVHGANKFKLRKPVQQLKTRGDFRLVERGIVCETKNKQELVTILASLGVSISKLESADFRVKRLCEAIRERLIELEIKERRKDSQYKYLYSWWNELVNLMHI